MNFRYFLKVYTLPIFVLLLGFGLYYLIFVYTNKPDSSSFAYEVLTRTSQNKLDLLSQEETSLKQIPQQEISSNQNLEQEIIQKSDEQDLILQANNPYIIDTNPQTQIYAVLPKVINIRQDPKITSEIVGKIAQNETLEVELIDKGWAKVKTLNKENIHEQNGWVLARLLTPITPSTISSPATSIEESTRSVLPTPSLPSPTIPVSIRAEKVIGNYLPTSSNVRIRSSPDLNAEVIGKLNPDEIIKIQTIKNDWAKVSNGWVSLKFLKKQED